LGAFGRVDSGAGGGVVVVVVVVWSTGGAAVVKLGGREVVDAVVVSVVEEIKFETIKPMRTRTPEIVRGNNQPALLEARRGVESGTGGGG